MLIIEGMPAERHLAFGSVSDDPAMRDFRMTSHLARYSGASFGAVAGRPSRPSITAAGRGAAGAPPRAPAAPGGAAARPRPAAFGLFLLQHKLPHVVEKVGAVHVSLG